MANIIAKQQKPTLILAPNKMVGPSTCVPDAVEVPGSRCLCIHELLGDIECDAEQLAAQLCNELKEFFPHNAIEVRSAPGYVALRCAYRMDAAVFRVVL
eukprot:1698766-Rhodomonas_salina.1